jgi:CBS domain-containing protein
MSFQELCHATIGDIVHHHQDLIAVEARSTIGYVLDFIEEHKLQTVGIYGTPGSWLGSGGVQIVSGGKQYIALVSTVDLLAFISQNGNIQNALTLPVIQAVGSTNESQSLWSEPYSRPIYFAMEQFCKGCHHALAVDDTHKHSTIAPKMIAQYDIIKYLYHHKSSTMPHLNNIFDQPIQSFMNNNVKTIPASSRLHDCLYELLSYHAIPVTDTDGTVISTISITDLSGTVSAVVANIHEMTVLDYLFYRHGSIRPPIFLSSTDTLGHAVENILSNHIHRVWISHDNGIGVLSCTDIIAAIYHFQY